MAVDSQQLRRRPVNIANLPPHIQQSLANGQPFVGEDGSTVYPDGTATGAGDSPDDFVSPYPAPQMTNYNPNAMPLASAPVAAPDVSPLANPMFDRYNKVARQGMPGQPPKQDPMAALMGQPDVAPQRNVQLSVQGPQVTYDGGGPNAGQGGQGGGTYGGRIGRRRSASMMRPPR